MKPLPRYAQYKIYALFQQSFGIFSYTLCIFWDKTFSFFRNTTLPASYFLYQNVYGERRQTFLYQKKASAHLTYKNTCKGHDKYLHIAVSITGILQSWITKQENIFEIWTSPLQIWHICKCTLFTEDSRRCNLMYTC